ncbi:sugar ABC transporter permease [Cohnella xylanilytica]|uniref:Carbohydrate ABC transporter permease n=1 Tax=Cohnella xylanilytica TaxID=557555 RepID=A0A841U4I0_9BACL|nr:carbohydrate ABC transporter permease [Cohnella xylanilytica]MBB6692894.1 carbohydrate ABC transporter permease [Cohnella xylanilytica]GIO15116.1 sugar ABC transporter permease [Cohnella xylanilytica]
MSQKTEKTVVSLLLGLFALYFLFPIYWTVTTSVKPKGSIIKLPPEWFPHRFTWSNYAEVFTQNQIGRVFLNSLLVASATTVVTVLVTALGGYGFSRFRFRGRNLWIYTTIIVRMIPGLLLIIPYYLMFQKAGLLDSLFGLVIVYVAAAIPLAIYLFIGFYNEMPGEIFESARIDGCSEYGAFFRIALPLVVPGIVVTSILVFMGAWNEFSLSLILTFSDGKKLLPLAISSLVQTQKDTPLGTLAAAGTLAMLPAIALSLTTQKYIVEGFTAGAVKG